MMCWLNRGLALLLLGSLGLAAYLDSQKDWRQTSRAYHRRDPQAEGPEPVQITTPSGEVDRCPTCHRGTLPGAKPGLTAHGKGHPSIPGHRDPYRWGCTPCHGGQGRRLDKYAHGPLLGGGPNPFLRQPFLQARCARCHVPTGLSGAPLLSQGFREYLDGGCSGCHQPGRAEQGLGPDLRRLGRRSEAELRQVLLNPRQDHPEAVMWSLTWRYDETSPQGRVALSALITALLALAESPVPYRNAWANPLLRADVDCNSCHSLRRDDQPAGQGHRCTLLQKNDNLRCSRCHIDRATRPIERGQECPQIQAARSLCAICHLRSGDSSREW